MPAENIFAQYARPVRSVTDYLADYDAQDARKIQLEGARRQNALAALTQQQTMRQMADADADRNALQSVAAGWTAQTKPEERIAALRNSGRPALMTQADALEKQAIERTKGEAEARAKQAEVLGKVLTAQGELATRVFANPTPQAAAAAIANMKAITQALGVQIDFSGDEAALSQFQSPDQIKQWAAGHALKAEQLLPKLQALNAGGQYVNQAVNPITGAVSETGRTDITQSADNKATNARLAADAAASRQVTIRGQNLTDERAREANKNAPGKAPPGYRFTPEGNLEAIPGGPADRKNTDAGIREQRAKDAAVAQADRVIAKVDSALEKVGVLTAGPGSVLSSVPGTDARNLQSTLETIKANLGFAELQAMRDASPTGGALGAIAVQELTALQSTVASLDQGQSPTQLRKSLQDINKHYSNWKKAVAGASGGAPAPTRQVKRTGTSNGRKVVEYTDGSIEYAD